MNAGHPKSTEGAHVIPTPGIDLVDWRRDTLVDMLSRRATENPELVLYTYLEDGESRERSITAAELDGQARRIGQTLARLAEPGARVVLLFDDGLDTIAGLFGCLHAGMVAVSGIHPAAPRGTERLIGIVRDCAASVVIGQARVLAEFQRALDDVIDDLDLCWIASDTIKPGKAEGRKLTPSGNGDVAFLQYTSGSSREPRGVMLSHRNVLHNLQSQFVAFGLRPGDTGVSWLPFSHDMGLIGCVLMAIYGGGRCILISPSHFLEDPLRWLRAITRYRASLSGGPNFAFELCARRAETAGIAGLDLSSWAVAVNGAEPIRAEVLRRFAAAFAPAGFRAEAIHPSYGLAEATLLVTTGARLAPFATRRLDRAALRDNRAIELAPDTEAGRGTELVDCGAKVDDQHLSIVHPATGQAAAAGEIGEIWIAGPSVSRGYFGRQEENAALFCADLGDGHGPYYRTGDLGFLSDGALFVTGRLRDLLIVRGKNYYPQDLEISAEASHKAVRPGCSACFLLEDSGELVALVELDRARHDEAEEVAAAVRDAIIRDHGVNPRHVVLAAWGAALKTPSGKIQRAQTGAAYADGRLAVVHASILADRPRAGDAPRAMDPQAVETWFVDRMREMGVDVAAFDPAMRLTDMGFDSLKIVEMKGDLERDLGIALNIADLYAFQDIGSLAEHLRALVRGETPSIPVPPTAEMAQPAQTAGRNRLADQRRARGADAPTPGGPASL